MGKPGMAGAHTNQRLSLSKPWEGLRRTCRGFEPDSGNLTVRDYRGASRNVRHGEIVTPSRNRKSGNGNPFTYSGARSNSIPTAKRARKAETPKQPSLYLMLRAPYLYPDQRDLSRERHRRPFGNAAPWISRRSESSETNSANNFRHLRRNRQRTCGGYCSSLSDVSVRRRTSLTKRRWHTEFEPG